MDTLFHFIFSVIAGMAVFRGVHRLHVIAGLAFLSILIDADHFLGMTARATFHNVFFVFALPFAAFLFFFHKGKGRKYMKFQMYALTLMVMLAGHLAADVLYGGNFALLYPATDARFSAPEFGLPFDAEIYPNVILSNIISKDGIALLVYALIIMAAFLIEDFIYFFEKQHKTARQALIRAKKDLF